MIPADVHHPQSQFVDDLFLDVADFRVVSVGNERYEITAALPNRQRILIAIRTARKGRIDTSIEADSEVLVRLPHQVSAEGRLSLLEVSSCSMHLEQMARGHYWLGLTIDGLDTVHIDFTTRGYLKVACAERSPSPDAGT